MATWEKNADDRKRAVQAALIHDPDYLQALDALRVAEQQAEHLQALIDAQSDLRRRSEHRIRERGIHVTIKSPFPYFGGKSRIAALVWERFGRVQNYVTSSERGFETEDQNVVLAQLSFLHHVDMLLSPLVGFLLSMSAVGLFALCRFWLTSGALYGLRQARPWSYRGIRRGAHQYVRPCSQVQGYLDHRSVCSDPCGECPCRAELARAPVPKYVERAVSKHSARQF